MQYFYPLVLAACFACASPPPAPSSVDEAFAGVRQRHPQSETVAAALRLANLSRLGIALPTPAELADPRSDGFWHGAAYAFAPDVREARAKVLASLGDAKAAGASDSIQARIVDHEFGGDDVLIESVISFDLIGLLGIGPSAAARELAAEQALLAVSNLEQSIWVAQHGVDRARVRSWAALCRLVRIQELRDQVAPDFVRVEILERNDRLGEAEAKHAAALSARFTTAIARAEEHVWRTRQELAIAAGLWIENPALSEQACASLMANHVQPTSPLGDLAPSNEHPLQRRALLKLSVSEALLRAESAKAWPGIRMGPHIGLPSGETGDVRLGGLLQLSLPVPSAWRGRIEARAAERDRQLERYQEVCLTLDNARKEAGERLRLAQHRAQAAVPQIQQASHAEWLAARARFRVARSDARAWASAVMHTIDSLNLDIDAAEEVALARLDQAELMGPIELEPLARAERELSRDVAQLSEPVQPVEEVR